MRKLTFHVKEVIDGIIHGIIFESNKEPKVFCTKNLDQSNKWDVRCYRVKQK